jgi:hypothetical protein
MYDQSHHNNQPLYQRLALMGKKSSSDVTFHAQLMSECAEDLWYKPYATADLHCPCHTKANAQGDIQHNNERCWPLNVTKRQCHLTITMTMIATIIVTCQHTHKTIAPLQLNRLEQAIIIEAKMLLASKMIDSSNKFYFHLRICQKVIACVTVPANASDATWTTIIVNAFLS